MFHVYVLRNQRGRFYIGQTDSLTRRLAEHNDSNDVTYPKIFHVGFMLSTVEEVNVMHDRLAAGGFRPEDAREEHGRFTFYFNAPGGFVVEVNCLR